MTRTTTTTLHAAALMLACLATAAAPAHAEPIELRYRFEPGQRWVAEGFTLGTIHENHGFPAKAFFSSRHTVEFAVESVADNGDAVIVYRPRRVRTNYKYDGGWVMEMDSDAPDAEAVIGLRATHVAPGSTWRFTLSARGVVTGVLDAEAAYPELRRRLTPAPEEAAEAERLLRKHYSAESMRHGLQQWFTQFPEHAVDVGETWTAAELLDYPRVRVEYTYRLKRIEDGVALLHGKGVCTALKPGEAPEAWGEPDTFDARGSVSFDVRRDAATGAPRGLRGEAEWSGVRAVHEPEPGMPERIPIQTRAKVTLTCTDQPTAQPDAAAKP